MLLCNSNLDGTVRKSHWKGDFEDCQIGSLILISATYLRKGSLLGKFCLNGLIYSRIKSPDIELNWIETASSCYRAVTWTALEIKLIHLHILRILQSCSNLLWELGLHWVTEWTLINLSLSANFMTLLVCCESSLYPGLLHCHKVVIWTGLFQC